MYARHVSFNLKAKREELTQTFEKDILPLLQPQDGFTDEITFVSPDGEDGIAIRHAGSACLRGRQLDLE